ncbi:hypothetical protein NKG05_10730 [Oerskovia sp. M15]
MDIAMSHDVGRIALAHLAVLLAAPTACTSCSTPDTTITVPDSATGPVLAHRPRRPHRTAG